jgi:hypothetical protein
MKNGQMSLDPVRITTKVTTVLEQLGVRYFISGSLASTLYGVVRTTMDSDVVADLKQQHIGDLVSSLENEFYIDEDMISAAVRQRSSFNIIHRDSFFKVDVIIPELRPYLNFQFTRAQRQVLSLEPEIQAMVVSPEDIVLAKLEWYRMGGEVFERHWRDVVGILGVQAGLLDMSYLNRMAEELGVKDLIQKALGG